MSKIIPQINIRHDGGLKASVWLRAMLVSRLVCILLAVALTEGMVHGEGMMAAVVGKMEYRPLGLYPGECGVRAVRTGKVMGDGFWIDAAADTEGQVEILRSMEIDGASYSVTEVSWSGFEGCDVGVLRIPSCITEIGTLAFSRAKGEMTVTGSVDVIGHYAFAAAEGGVKINEGVRYIYDNAFGGFVPDRNGMSGTSIVLPSTVESVGRNILGTSLGGNIDAGFDTVQCHATVPPVIESGVDGDYDLYESPESYHRVVLYVPDGSVESYRAAPGWSKFTDIRPLSAAGIESVIAEAPIEIGVREGMCVIISSDPRPIPVKIYSAEGRQIYFGHDREIPLRAGIYVVRAATTSAKILVR